MAESTGKHRTTVELDVETLEQAQEVLGTTTIRETIDRALHEVVQLGAVASNPAPTEQTDQHRRRRPAVRVIRLAAAPVRFMVGPWPRRAVRETFDLARSAEARKLAGNARHWAQGLEPRKVADYGIWAASETTVVVKYVANRDRLADVRAAPAKLKP